MVLYLAEVLRTGGRYLVGYCLTQVQLNKLSTRVVFINRLQNGVIGQFLKYENSD